MYEYNIKNSNMWNSQKTIEYFHSFCESYPNWQIYYEYDLFFNFSIALNNFGPQLYLVMLANL